jgi:hypothetical protein
LRAEPFGAAVEHAVFAIVVAGDRVIGGWLAVALGPALRGMPPDHGAAFGAAWPVREREGSMRRAGRPDVIFRTPMARMLII